MKSHRIYLASSWRNVYQPGLVTFLRSLGYEVYDFKDPRSGGPVNPLTPAEGFDWKHAGDVTTRSGYRDALRSQVAQRGYAADKNGMDWADTCVMSLACGKSAHMEFGYMSGQGKKAIVYWPNENVAWDAELMYLIGDTLADPDKVLAFDLPELVHLLKH